MFNFYKKNQKEKPQGIHMLKRSKGPQSTYQPTRESWVDTNRPIFYIENTLRFKIYTNYMESRLQKPESHRFKCLPIKYQFLHRKYIAL